MVLHAARTRGLSGHPGSIPGPGGTAIGAKLRTFTWCDAVDHLIMPRIADQNETRNIQARTTLAELVLAGERFRNQRGKQQEPK